MDQLETFLDVTKKKKRRKEEKVNLISSVEDHKTGKNFKH